MKNLLQRWLLLLSFSLAVGARGQSPTLAGIETTSALYAGSPVQLTGSLTVAPASPVPL